MRERMQGNKKKGAEREKCGSCERLERGGQKKVAMLGPEEEAGLD